MSEWKYLKRMNHIAEEEFLSGAEMLGASFSRDRSEVMVIIERLDKTFRLHRHCLYILKEHNTKKGM